MAIDPNIKKKADDIRTKVYGSEVRGALASGLELMSSSILTNISRQEAVENRQDDVEGQWQSVVDATTGKDVVAAPEIIASRTGVGGTVHENLKERLDTEKEKSDKKIVSVDNQVNNVRLAKHSNKQMQFNSKKPKGAVVFTLDDGAIEDYTITKPLFDEFGFPATIFIISQNVGGNYAGRVGMTYEQIKELEDDGWEIGAHTQTHPDLRNVSIERARKEIVGSYNDLSKMGFKVTNFAYPYGGRTTQTEFITMENFRTASLFMSWIKENEIPLKKMNLQRRALGSFYDPVNDDFPITNDFNNYYKYWVDHAVANNNLTVFALHPWAMVDDAEQMGYLRDTLQYCKDIGVDVLTLDDALDRFDNKIDIKIHDEAGQVQNQLIVDANGEIRIGKELKKTFALEYEDRIFEPFKNGTKTVPPGDRVEVKLEGKVPWATHISASLSRWLPRGIVFYTVNNGSVYLIFHNVTDSPIEMPTDIEVNIVGY